MILAISASPRKRMTYDTLNAILKDCKEEYEIISLAGKKISGCIACTACAKDNVCKVRDDWNEIGEKMKKADIIIFGGANYYGMLNAIGHCALERTFCFRHKGGFSLEGKKGMIVAAGRINPDSDPVTDFVKKMFISNKIETIGNMRVDQYSQCYTCGEGHNCMVGNVVPTHGILDEILPCHLPKELCEREDSLKEIERMRDILKSHGIKFN